MAVRKDFQCAKAASLVSSNKNFSVGDSTWPSQKTTLALPIKFVWLKFGKYILTSDTTEIESHDMNEALLDKFDALEKNPPAWGANDKKLEHLHEQIQVLRELQRCGCQKTRNGLEVELQLNERCAKLPAWTK